MARPSAIRKVREAVRVQRVRLRLTPIARLLLACSPATVARLVVAVVVDSVDAVLHRWSWPHVGKEGREIGAPSVTNGDAATSVVLVTMVGRAVTPFQHRCPGFVLWCLASVRRVPVLPITSARFVPFDASASTRPSGPACDSGELCAAIAPDEPVRHRLTASLDECRMEADVHQAPKALARSVSGWPHMAFNFTACLVALGAQ